MRLHKIAAALAAVSLTIALPGLAAAESLAGKVGDKRSNLYFPQGAEGGCQRIYKAYVGAGGHSAYASTMSGPGIPYSVCGSNLNAASQAAAEQRAATSCEKARAKYKVQLIGTCKVVASK